MKPYIAKSLQGAQRKVRRLIQDRHANAELIKKLHDERVLMAKLAAEGPAFFNPLRVAAAKKIRNEILRKYCNMKPDGTFIEG